MFSRRNIVVDILILVYYCVNARCSVLQVPRDKISTILLQEKSYYRYALSLNRSVLCHHVKSKGLQLLTEPKLRIKRQKGGSMPEREIDQGKIFKMWFEAISSLFSKKNDSIAHPLHETVPIAFVKFLKSTDTQRAFSNPSLVQNPRNITNFTKQILLKWKPEGRQNDERHKSTQKAITNSDKIVEEKKIGDTVSESYTRFYQIGNLTRKMKTASNTIPKLGKCKIVTRSKNLSRRWTENTTPVLFTNKVTEWEEMPTVTTEKTELNVLSDAVVELLLMTSDSKENVRKVKNIRKKRAQTYTVTHKPYWKLTETSAEQLASMVAHVFRRLWRATPHSRSQKFTPEMLLTRPVYILMDKMGEYIFPADKRFAQEQW